MAPKLITSATSAHGSPPVPARPCGCWRAGSTCDVFAAPCNLDTNATSEAPHQTSAPLPRQSRVGGLASVSGRVFRRPPWSVATMNNSTAWPPLVGYRTAPRGSGRPARFHDGTCRQRVHRAKAAHRSTAVLIALDAVEAAVSELRRAVLTAGPSTKAADQLAHATSDLLGQLSEQTPSPPTDLAVTGSVTIPASVSTDAATGATHAEPPPEPPSPSALVTEPVAISAASDDPPT